MTFRKRQIVAAIFFSVFLRVIPAVSLAGTFRDNFDDGDFMGWKPNVATGISVVDGELQFKSADPLIVKVGSLWWEGYSLEIRVRVAKFTNSGWFSIRILQSNTGDTSGYYELRLSRAGTMAMLHVNNLCVESFRVPTVLEENVWHDVRIKPSNGKVLFYLDEILTAQLTDLELSGYVDMCTTKGTYVYVDDVTVTGPNIPDTGPNGPNSFAIGSRLRLSTTWGKIKRN